MSKQDPFKLYLVRISPCCRSVWLYLLQNDLPVELIDVDIFEGEHKNSKFMAMNPHQEVPVLVDGKTIIYEGIAILRYLAQKYTNFAGWGSTLEQRSEVLSVMHWGSTTLHRVLGYRHVYPHFVEKYHLKSHEDTEKLVEQGAHELTKQLEVLESHYLKKNPFLCGKELTVADTYVATVLCQAEWVNLEIPSLWPRVFAWFTKVKSQPKWYIVHEQHDMFLHKLAKCHDEL
ncbi:predicted protein [Nematostella vectensis]|uniref:Glutathione transferase n=1 Tax=Nematostella vectensis TaxID=45351 RepID=A7T2G1_NEMVE|nr:glutathione S-transferase theta-1 [Nematostella vectensis]EDO29852.1 predicted protein [Nematostella vectensis]|eukprot:XP_001621952.1 hypothetical protein NEMVEDRAFT_v1g237669 [Nematostella vectensis]